MPIHSGLPFSSLFTNPKQGANQPTHHGYPCDSHDDFGKIISTNLQEGGGVLNQTQKTHLTTPKEALRKQEKLNTQTLRTTQINWDWDMKRVLTNPEVNIWNENSKSVPWCSLEDLINNLSKNYRGVAKTTQQKQISYGKKLGMHLGHLAGWKQEKTAKIYGTSQQTVSRFYSRDYIENSQLK
jgi:hypothetical protein